jgi:hypothetical protein
MQPLRGIEPHVHALDQIASHGHVVVFQEHQPPGELGPLDLAIDLLDQLFARVIGRVGLAGQDELHRRPRAVDDFQQPLGIVQQQVGALVGGEAPGEADRQHVRIQQHPAGHHLHRMVVSRLP